MEREELIKMWLSAAPNYTRESYASLEKPTPNIAFHVLREWGDRQVWCPHCRAICAVDTCDGNGDLVTYHGEDGPVELECPACEQTFYVQEHVRRTYTSGKTAEEAGE